MELTVSLSRTATKSSVMAVFKRRVEQGIITKADADSFDAYLEKNPAALTKAGAGNATPTQTAERLYKIRYGKIMQKALSDRQDKEKAEKEKAKPVFKKEDANSDVVDRWNAYAKKEDLSKEEIEKGLQHINYQRRFNKHDGSIENKTGAAIWRATNK